jgi:hypothetical protein
MVLPQFGGIPGLPTGPQSFAPPLTQEQLNQLSPEDLDRVKQQLGRAGAPRPTAQQQLQGYIGQAGQFLGALPGQARETTEKIKQRFPQAGAYARGGLALAGALPAAGVAMEELQAGRSLGAVAALAPAGLSAVGAGLIGKGPIGTVAGLGLMGLGAILPGASASAAESTRQKLTGEPTKGKEGEFSTQMAMNKQLAELGTTQYRDNMGVYTSTIRDLSRDASNQAYLDLQRNIPLINQMKNADLVRQQALLNTQGQIQGQLGVLATAGALAQGAQAGNFALTQTALTSNPYAGSTVQAPAIRFG